MHKHIEGIKYVLQEVVEIMMNILKKNACVVECLRLL